MYKLTVKLKQHTPLIHFQHEQEGATLRATELKPKLDKFLIKKLGIEKLKSLFIGNGDKPALDYKIRITPQSNVDFFDIEKVKTDRNNRPSFDKRGNPRKVQFPAFFANMGSDGDEKKFSYCEKLDLIISSFNKELTDEIKKHISEFFAFHNFGTRQSKGFGSFYPTKNNEEGIYIEPKKFFTFHFFREANERDFYRKQYVLFEAIDLFYRSLRSGINLKNRDRTMFYSKSLLFLYAKYKGWQWEKKTIKQKFFSGELASQNMEHDNPDILDYDSNNKYLLKDLLGLSSDELWLSYRTSITKEHPHIDRYKSPLLFKPIDLGSGKFDVFFYAFPVSREILNETFKIRNKKGGNFDIKTPSEFDIDKFLDFLFLDMGKPITEFKGESGFYLEDHIDEEFHNHRNFKILYKIFDSINENLLEDE